MKRILIAALAAALVGLAFIGGGMGLAAAQGEDTAVQTFLGRVAEKLGIGEDELRSAMTEVEQEIVDEKVAEGLLTPEQGERLKERIEEGNPLGPRGLHRIRKAARHHEGRLLLGSAATVLNMEPEELRSELQEDKTLAQVAEEQGMPLDQFIAALLGEAGGKLDELVAEGKLTETQANAIFERLENNIDDIVNALPKPRGPRPPGPNFQRLENNTEGLHGPRGARFERVETNIEA